MEYSWLPRLATAAILTTVCGSAFCETLLDLPVSSVGNPAYLTSLSGRPWWNKAWSRRAPLLVASGADVPDGKATVCVEIDLGERVRPDEVRLVTPWEKEIPCVCETRKGTKIALFFQTAFRVHENKPFLVYWGNPKATRPSVGTYLTLTADESEYRLANGLLEVTFDRLARTPGPIKRIRLLSSQAENELLGRATGYAWRGFELSVGGVRPQPFDEAAVVMDNAQRKMIRFSNAQADVFFSLSAESPSLEWRYRLKNGARDAALAIAWACGGDVAQDDLVYPGASGKPLVLRAELDAVTDNIPHPEHELGSYVSEGWIAIRDRRANESVGVLFDRASLRGLRYWGHSQASGEEMTFSFGHEPTDGVAAGQTGALVALRGGVEDLIAEYRRRARPRVALVGATQGYAEHPLAKPRFDRDFIVDYNIGFDSGMGWRSGNPLEGKDWAESLMDTLRSYGANATRAGHYNDYTPYMKLSRDLYERVREVAMRPGSTLRKKVWPEWTPERYSGEKLSEYCAAAHRRGMGVSNWSTFMCLGYKYKVPGLLTDPDLAQIDREMQSAFADSGVDVFICQQPDGEGPTIPDEILKEQGTPWYWKWKDPSVYFDKVVEPERECLRLSYAEAKKRHPDTCFMLFHSEDGEIKREKYSSEFAGDFDSLYVEMLPRGNFPKCKYVAKRMRALFDNEAGRTVHHHFYFYKLTERCRIDDIEMPFICGVNGFSTEALSFRQCDREYSEIPADFYRFAEYTQIGAKAARMAPVRDLAVFRDDAAFRADVLARRTVGEDWWDTYALNDRRVAAFGNVPNLVWDIVINRFFTQKALAKYRVVYLPSNEVFSDKLARELLAYVKAGGGAIIEGETARACGTMRQLQLKADEIRVYGKGRIAYRADNLSERLANGTAKDQAELRKLMADVGSCQPYSVSDPRLDTVLQASDKGCFLGVCNLDRRNAVKASFRLLDPKLKKKDAHVLDVKNGKRFALADEFEISAEAGQCAYYLIGPGDFASPPTVRPATNIGGGLTSSRPRGIAARKPSDELFAPSCAIEFVASDQSGHPVEIRRSREAMIKRIAFSEVKPETFAKALADAAYIHFQTPAESWDPLFNSCNKELKEFLKRGGGLFFDRQKPGRHAHKFLGDIGVADPFVSERSGVGDGNAEWLPSASTNSPLFAVISPGFSTELHCSSAFAQWDAARQFAPYRANLATDHAVVVAQDGVCGKGRILFSTVSFVFGDYYENRAFGNSVLSWFIGMPVSRHATLTRELNGGPGTPLGMK